MANFTRATPSHIVTVHPMLVLSDVVPAQDIRARIEDHQGQADRARLVSTLCETADSAPDEGRKYLEAAFAEVNTGILKLSSAVSANASPANAIRPLGTIKQSSVTGYEKKGTLELAVGKVHEDVNALRSEVAEIKQNSERTASAVQECNEALRVLLERTAPVV